VARVCTVCNHANQATIDSALVAGDAYRHIAARFGVSTTALQRHKAEHLPVHLVQAHEAAAISDADSLLGQLRSLNRETLAVLDAAKQSGDLRLALGAISQTRANLELLAKLAGQLAQEGTTNIVIQPEYLQVRAVIVTALAPYPDARLAVVQALTAAEAARA
jgi:hypothetical protein